MPTNRKKSTRRAKASPSAGSTPKASRSAERPDKSIEAFRDALEKSITLPRERIQEVADDAVRRGRMTRDDANELVSKLVSRGRKQSAEFVRDLESLIEGARKHAGRARRQVKGTAGKVARGARDAADEPLARVDTVRRRAGVGPSFPITGYDELTAVQINKRIGGLTKPELRKVRTHEQNGKARKSILEKIDRALA